MCDTYRAMSRCQSIITNFKIMLQFFLRLWQTGNTGWFRPRYPVIEGAVCMLVDPPGGFRCLRADKTADFGGEIPDFSDPL